MITDCAGVCGFRRIRPWRDRQDTVLVRYYRVPKGTPVLPIPHAFMCQENWDRKQWCAGMEPSTAVGEVYGWYRYDKGVAPAAWRKPTKFIGTPEQWLLGSEFPRHQPLIWSGEFSRECRESKIDPAGMACAECGDDGLTSPLWEIRGIEDFAGMQQAVLVHVEGCQFSSQCVAPGTAAAWEVIPEQSFGGLAGGIVYSRDVGVWSGCCRELV